ncbi:hypothetical protein A9Q91_03680 [Candidatus Gracilibacteria bacterium 28_42_T64]|nr:hypothetical protein A9Q91_03680 [Candidatus Gracilibacteria bacterium 28_42_T64]
MKINKLIITTQKTIFTQVLTRFQLSKVDGESGGFEIYTGTNIITDESEDIVLLYCDNKSIELGITDVLDNYDVEKVLALGYAEAVIDFELNIGDVILPNTFIDSIENGKSIFLEYAIGESYDLHKFGLVLNGLCLSTNDKKNVEDILEEEGIDIVDTESHEVLSILGKNNLIEKTVVLKGIIGKDTDNLGINDNIVQVLELVL